MQPREYELVMVLSPRLDEGAVTTALDRVASFVGEAGGEVASQEQWGMRRLSYIINNFNEGNYIISQLRLVPSTVHSLEEKLTSTEEVIRYLLVRKEAPRPSAKIKAKVKVNPAAVNPEAVNTAAVNPEAVNTAAVNPEAVNTATVNPEAVNTAAVNPEAVNTAAVNPEAAD